MKKPALKADDGAEFVGLIAELEGGNVRASCYAQQDHKHSVETEEPQSMLCASRALAEQWIGQQAGSRGFRKYKLLPA